MRLWSWQAVAHGADGVLFFQWRQSRGGAEKFHSGMVPHAGTDTRTFHEVKALGAELAELPELAGTRIRNHAALLLDWQSWWALEIDSHPSAAVDQLGSLTHHYAPLFEAGIGTDVIHPDTDLSAYRLLVVPNLYLLREETADRLDAWVRDGGHLVVSYFSGVVDACDRVHLGGYLGPLAATLGLDVEEYLPLGEDRTVRVDFTADSACEGAVWSERIRMRGATALATFGSGDLAGLPAVTWFAHGRGAAWYLGTRLDDGAMRRLLDTVRDEADVRPVLPELPDGVQAAVREGDGTRLLILLNHADEPRTVALPEGATLATGTARGTAAREITLAARDVAVLRLPIG
jgi:beta-galactosidase